MTHGTSTRGAWRSETATCARSRLLPWPTLAHRDTNEPVPTPPSPIARLLSSPNPRSSQVSASTNPPPLSHIPTLPSMVSPGRHRSPVLDRAECSSNGAPPLPWRRWRRWRGRAGGSGPDGEEVAKREGSGRWRRHGRESGQNRQDPGQDGRDLVVPVLLRVAPALVTPPRGRLIFSTLPPSPASSTRPRAQASCCLCPTSSAQPGAET